MYVAMNMVKLLLHTLKYITVCQLQGMNKERIYLSSAHNLPNQIVAFGLRVSLHKNWEV